MTRKKVYALVLCLALLIAAVLPGTLAVSNDTADSTGSFTLEDQQPSEETPTEEEPPAEEMPADPEDPAEDPSENPSEDPDETPAETPDETPADQPAPSHIDTCYDGCTEADCLCGCHLVSRVLACTTLDEIWAVLDAASDAAIHALTYEQNAQIEAKIKALEPAPAPAVVVEESNDETVPSEIVYETVNYTDVAPLVDSVTDGY